MSVALATALETVKGSPRDNDATGMYARFVRVSATHGLKFYQDRRVARKTYDRQKQAAAVGLAPQVGEWVEFDLGEDDRRYGYMTETIVETAREYSDNMFHLNHRAASRLENKFSDMGDELERQVRDATGIELCDVHPSNFGFMANGDIVCIDFSHTDSYSNSGRDSSF